MITRLIYPITLLLSIGKKTCESMGEIADLSGDSMLRMLNTDITLEEKCRLVNNFFKFKSLAAFVDDVLIDKKYSKEIEGSSDHYDSSSHTYYRSLCSVVLMLSNGYYHIPITHKLWVSEEIMEDDYQKKHEIALEVIKSVLKFCKIRVVVADALYANLTFMSALNILGLAFEMKIHSNRVVILKDGTKGPIKHVLKPKLNGKRWRTVPVIWNNFSLYITAYKRYNKHGVCKIIYQVSNFKTTAQSHVNIYKSRWHIETFFRTAKQSLGLKDCQSRSAVKQTNHINKVFMAYTILQMERKKRRLKTPEAALKRIKRLDYNSLHSYLLAQNQIFSTIFA